ncbi:uncharacterized protein RBU57_012376 [Macrochelys suwanniensis]
MMESQNRRRAPAWTEREVHDLITVWGDETVLAELRSKRRNANTYAKVSKGMQDRGYNRDAQQCRVKIKELRQAYQKTRDANSHSGSEPQTCCFYDELHAILGGAASTDPPMWYDSVCGSSETTEEHFQGEEDGDNDAQNSAQTQQGSREALFPDSQELFVTLEPVPYEPTQGVLDAGEGTSAANVSTPPLSSPSQRLAKIRSKKKRNRDDMFTELLQSSHTETAQQNAWRQTLSKSRKAEFDRADRSMPYPAMGKCLEDLIFQRQVKMTFLEIKQSKMECDISISSQVTITNVKAKKYIIRDGKGDKVLFGK